MEIITDVFSLCYKAIRTGIPITRESTKDKEYHFQNWFKSRLLTLNRPFDEPGRNTYPDFKMVRETVGFELKGLQTPGRIKNYDSNSQVPTGFHNGREVYYVFGRYDKTPLDPKKYPVMDLIICHGDFLNADHDYVHKNKSVKQFGSYGDIMIRDRKMYVCPTPYALTEGTEGQITLITPKDLALDNRLRQVGDLKRTECDKLIKSYEFDLETNELISHKIPNPNAGRIHEFKAYRVKEDEGPLVKMRD
ncbi:hypothetical protein [Christiangramia sp. SM2212]|uniref:Restriction endonuclease n=1 Tax=Christiangramia sediminicola TaxID=3073267 RepID=A0ABU1EQX8_9FLAO|nr:hypothetical protein [Christiangramia sp. SM2212]MDR5590800.1 hypothetical protein [Christiangramia sp. SM2212]